MRFEIRVQVHITHSKTRLTVRPSAVAIIAVAGADPALSLVNGSTPAQLDMRISHYVGY